jgi:hypothetical protein
LPEAALFALKPDTLCTGPARTRGIVAYIEEYRATPSYKTHRCLRLVPASLRMTSKARPHRQCNKSTAAAGNIVGGAKEFHVRRGRHRGDYAGVHLCRLKG